MRLTLIVAASDNDVIGINGTLPWHLPDDMKRFKELTTGHPVIMGRKTYESIGRPLPGRRNIVVTRQPMLKIPGCIMTHSLEHAIRDAEHAGAEEAYLIGGGELYAQAMVFADAIELTRVHTVVDNGDTFFPQIDLSVWKEISRQEHFADAEHAYAFTYVRYERV